MYSDPHRAPEDGTGARFQDPVARAVLWAAVVLAAARLYALGRWSLWIDEAYTLADSMHGVEILNPVGYRVFGAFYAALEQRPDEFLLRLPSALVGWACVPLSAWALRPLVGRRAAAFAALFVALSPWHLYWSQNARFYTLAQALGLLGLRGVLGALSGASHSLLRLALGVGAFALATGTHPSAGFLFGATLGVPILLRVFGLWPASAAELERSRTAWRCVVTLPILAAIVGALWVIEVWDKWETRQGAGSPLHLVLSTGYLVSPWVGLGVLVGCWRILRERLAEARVLPAIIAAAFLAVLAVSFAVRASAQYVFVLFPLIAGLAALPFGRAQLRFRELALLLVIAAPLAFESTLYFAVRNGDRPHWREAYRFVFDARDETDLILGMDAPVGEYYWNPTSDDLRNYRTLEYLDKYRANVPRDWARYGRRTWFLVNHEQLEDWPADDREVMRKLLEEECERVESFLVPWMPRDLDVHVYRYDP